MAKIEKQTKKGNSPVSEKQYNLVCKDKFQEINTKLDGMATKDDQFEIKEMTKKMYHIMFEGNGIPAVTHIAKDFIKLQKEHDGCQKIVAAAEMFMANSAANERTFKDKAISVFWDLIKVGFIAGLTFIITHK